MLLLGVLLAHGAVGTAAAEPPVEYRVKAAMLYNFTRFISWPDTDADRLRLCVTGEGPLSAALAAIDGKRTGERILEVRGDVPPADLDGCHMAFVSRSMERELAALLEGLGSAPVVTVSDMPRFVERGGMVELVLVEGKVRFEINIAVAEAADLRFSSKLLRLARRVVRGDTP